MSAQPGFEDYWMGADEPATEVQVRYLLGLGQEISPGLTKAQASKLIRQVKAQPATERQIGALSRAGVDGSAMTYVEARRELAKHYKGNTLAYMNGEERKAAGLTGAD